MPAKIDAPATKGELAIANQQIAALRDRLDQSESRYYELRAILVTYQKSHQAAQTVLRQFVDRTYAGGHAEGTRREIDKSG